MVRSLTMAQLKSPLDIVPRTLVGRVLAALAALVVIIAGFFFLAIALAIGGIILFVVFVRVMWLLHRARREADKRSRDRTIEVDYTVTDEADPRRLERERDGP